MNNQDQLEIPIQPVEKPILCSPYELHNYEPDFIVRLKTGMHLILEIKGYETEQDRAKHAGAGRWLSAVNNWGGLGKWGFHVCKDPQLLREELATFQHGNNS